MKITRYLVILRAAGKERVIMGPTNDRFAAQDERDKINAMFERRAVESRQIVEAYASISRVVVEVESDITTPSDRLRHSLKNLHSFTSVSR